jgi:CelD/BcsL family acetyltransferase involved in cellulose biosynthesis
MFTSRNFRTLSAEQWQAFQARHPSPTFFASPAWALAFNESDPRIVPQPLVFDIRGGPAVLLPAVRARNSRLAWRVYVGFPLGGYDVVFTTGGDVVEGELLQRALQQVTELNLDSIELTIWPMLAVTCPAGWQAHRYEASVIDLKHGADAAIERMDGRSRRMAGQAQRRGVACVQQTDANGLDAYYDLLLLSAKRWGRTAPTVTKRFLQALLHHGAADVEIWLAIFEEKPIAGIVALYGSSEVNVWSAAMDSEYSVLRPHNILNVTLMRAAAERGMRWYNLGSSEGLPGVKKFKDGLGAETVFYDRLTFEKGAYKFYRRLRERRRPAADVASETAES